MFLQGLIVVAQSATEVCATLIVVGWFQGDIRISTCNPMPLRLYWTYIDGFVQD